MFDVCRRSENSSLGRVAAQASTILAAEEGVNSGADTRSRTRDRTESSDGDAVGIVSSNAGALTLGLIRICFIEDNTDCLDCAGDTLVEIGPYGGGELKVAIVQLRRKEKPINLNRGLSGIISHKYIRARACVSLSKANNT